MTETRLRTRTHGASYLLTVLCLGTLATQNLRYGFYDLFYLAAAMVALSLAGTGYTLLSRRHQLSAPGHLVILAGLGTGLLTAQITMDSPGISHWAMPLLLLNLLILPLRRGLALSALLLIAMTVILLFRSGVGDTVTTLSGMVALTAVAALYIWHYDHMTQSAEDLAIIDPLTGAHNARFLDETLQKEISRSIATGHPLSVIHLGIDYAEEIRNLHGEQGLHALSQAVTQHLFGAIRAGDSVYALSEADFFLILPFTPEEGVRVIAERIRRTIAEHTWPVVGKASVSLGCTTRGHADTRTDTLRQRAREAMQEAREHGGNSVWFRQGEAVEE